MNWKRMTSKYLSGASEPSTISRRTSLRWIGAVAGVPLGAGLGCDDEEANEVTANAGAATTSQTTAENAPAPVAWATGGTAAMTALASYPNPFQAAPDPACTPTCSMILGPCHDDQAPDREDISEGEAGLPMRFGLRVVDDECAPVSGADVDIWHTDSAGIYSSETSDSPDFCVGDNPVALAKRFFRGHQLTDENGVAWFNSCFPGWYAVRAIHIHVTVRRLGRNGDNYLTTQLAFQTSLIDDICTTHPDYQARGLPAVTNTTDGVFPSEGYERYAVETQRMSDGAMLAWKTLIIRSALDTELCSEGMAEGAPGGAGFPGDGGVPPLGDGGFPPDGFPPGGGLPPGMGAAGGGPMPAGS
jgi:protocatechuate 3,4-dioxygenase beta subunit